MIINSRVSSLEGSSTLKITALAKKLKKEGKDVVNLAAGEPDFDTPQFVKEEAKKAIDEGFTKYTPSSGMLELREAIAKKLREENGIPCNATQIIVTTGAKYALFASIFTLIDTTDEVILPSPFWVSYPEMVKLVGGTIKYLPTQKKNNFKINPKDLERAITKKTKMLILNYPANPTGVTYTETELWEIYEVVKEKNIVVLSDEIYEKLLYDGKTHTSFARFPGADKFTVTVNGFSKSFSMTGWRIGYLAASDEIIAQVSKVIDHTTSCVSSITQRGALAALKHSSWQKEMCKDFAKKRDLLWEGLRSCRPIEALRSEGAFYMFCNIAKTGLTSQEFAGRLLEEHQVCVIPADSFGAKGFVRLSFATSVEEIEKGVKRIRKFLATL
ncbi:MAG: pyridoxal phosphate-dependent aminotransferase [Candidatus Omnitrophica bacterium]|nr:pyridoxal phosphate-dependent aminotransferase [Candidatus Omnitrophota bacterium]